MTVAIAPAPQGKQPAVEPRLLNKIDVAHYLRISQRTLSSLRQGSGFPQPDFHLGPTMPRWTRESVDTWIDQGKLSPEHAA